MFDRNRFKDAFRGFVLAHPLASEDDVVAFCQQAIPAHSLAAEYWLVDQCLQWFRWLQTQPSRVSARLGADAASSSAFEEEPH